MKWIKRILLGIGGIIVLLILALAGFIFFDLSFGAKASDVSNINFVAGDDSALYGYLAMPEGEGTFPAVLMVHEWWGLNAELTEMADRLAEKGYVVLAPDTYRGATTRSVPSALYLRLTVPTNRVDEDMWAAYHHLTSLPEVDTSRIAIIGFCYGGGVAMRHAIANSEIVTVVNLYGSTIQEADAFGALLEHDSPVLGIFGAEDAQISVEEVKGFEAALNTAGIENIITIYDGVGHAFVNPTTIDAGGAEAEAWTQILAFLDSQLKG
jgi:carboxymethylenebutenolidase